MKEFLKRSVAIVIVGLLLLSVFGCSNDGQETPDTSDSSDLADDSSNTEGSPVDTGDDSEESTSDNTNGGEPQKPDGVGEIFDWNGK